MKILNLTQHAGTQEQGVLEVADNLKIELRTLLNFEELPTPADIKSRAQAIAAMAVGYDAAMIGGAPFLMGALEAALKAVGVQPLYAFSRRESVERTRPDGSVEKVAVFRHLGFVEA